MGLYIEVPEKFGKVRQLKSLYNAEPLPSYMNVDQVPANKVQICVILNNAFEAALIVGDGGELQRVLDSKRAGDTRPTIWLLMDKAVVENLNPSVISYFGDDW